MQAPLSLCIHLFSRLSILIVILFFSGLLGFLHNPFPQLLTFYKTLNLLLLLQLRLFGNSLPSYFIIIILCLSDLSLLLWLYDRRSFRLSKLLNFILFFLELNGFSFCELLSQLSLNKSKSFLNLSIRGLFPLAFSRVVALFSFSSCLVASSSSFAASAVALFYFFSF